MEMSEVDAISVRLADGSDSEAIAGLVTTLAAELKEHSPITPAYVADYLCSPGAHALLAVRGQTVLGLISFTFRPSLYHAADSCLVDVLVVHPAERNCGLGTRLLQEAIQRARAHRCAEVSLSIMISNQDALRFYQRHAFGDQALLLECHLPSEPQ
jgi:ribosomal protein S18 acetylase RimI-like enzyme